jgi:peptidoglycan hydrolase-like protein with peptidoglycan-binding domain
VSSDLQRVRAATLVVAATIAAVGAPPALASRPAQTPAPARSSSATLLQTGSRGMAVRRLQAALDLPRTGRWTARTTRAVRRFQRRHHLVVDGIVGPRTAAALGLRSRPVAATATTSAASLPAGVRARLSRIAACESGGNPRAISPGGRYRGKYQFSRATWRGLGGTGDPAQASEAEQDRLAAQLLAQSGTSPWPNCG